MIKSIVNMAFNNLKSSLDDSLHVMKDTLVTRILKTIQQMGLTKEQMDAVSRSLKHWS
jgi:hypothetical protein